LIALAAVLAAATAAGFSGFGFNVIAVPLMALVLPTKDAVTVGLLLGVLAAGFPAIHALRQHQINLRILGVLLVGSVPGLLVGTMAFDALGSQGLRILIGVITAVFPLVFLTTRLSQPRQVRLCESLGVGFVGGSFAATTGTGGPPIAVYLLTTIKEAKKLRGTILGHVASVTLLALILHAFRGQISHAQLGESARLAPAAVVGLVIGAVLFRVASAHTYQQLLRAILAVVAVAGVALAVK
jgi:uncharacterized membrane protein YfcA